MLLAQCFAGPGQAVAYSQYGFAVFAIAAAAAGAPTTCVPALPRDDVDAPLGHDLAAIAAACRDGVRLVYLANPNNPTGTWFGADALQAFMAQVPADTLVVVDEAYGEYMDAPGLRSALRLVDTYPNLVVTRTFSKAYALAGLRVGYAIAHASVIEVLERLRESFNVNNVALAAALAALADREHLDASLRANAEQRALLAAELHARGYGTLPSQTNFLLLDTGVDAAPLENQLYARGVIVRPMGGYGLPQTLRISVGSPAENRRLLEALP
jgi:histidinol-phosphate aminotransferase